VETAYFIHPNGTLSTDAPQEADASSTSFVYDPANPVPSMGGNNLEACVLLSVVSCVVVVCCLG